MKTSEEKMLTVEAWLKSGITQQEYCKTLGQHPNAFIEKRVDFRLRKN